MSDARPDILLIMTDQQRADCLSIAGHPVLQTPNLDTIAAGHCTGWRAVTMLANIFGDTVVDPSVVGKRYTF